MFVDKTQSLDNKPNTSSNYGFLETIAINEVTIKQTFVDFQSRFFIRICNNGTWTDWMQQGTQQPVEGISGLPHGPGSGFSKYRPVWWP